MEYGISSGAVIILREGDRIFPIGIKSGRLVVRYISSGEYESPDGMGIRGEATEEWLSLDQWKIRACVQGSSVSRLSELVGGRGTLRRILLRLRDARDRWRRGEPVVVRAVGRGTDTRRREAEALRNWRREILRQVEVGLPEIRLPKSRGLTFSTFPDRWRSWLRNAERLQYAARQRRDDVAAASAVYQKYRQAEERGDPEAERLREMWLHLDSQVERRDEQLFQALGL